MKKNINIFKYEEKIIIFLLLLFSLIINQYYGNKGIFPLDSFSHFDRGFGILLGEHPFKDYWVISGPVIDYFQSFFFYIFGTNWQSYIFHASSVNALVVLSTFVLLRNFNLNVYISFIYSIGVAILAYPSSGTPFVDHHSVFFSLLGLYFLILAIKNDSKLYWSILPFFFTIAFFSKVVPSLYIVASVFFVLIFYTLVNKNFNWIKYSFFSLVLIVLVIISIAKIFGINFSSFLTQYIFYPQTLGTERYSEIDFSFKNIFLRFKFIYISLLPLIYINFKNLFFKKNYFKEKDFIYFLILIFLTFSLIFHQLLTKNQIFIFFLIPILTAFSHISLMKYNKKSKIIIFLILSLFFYTTFKYHLRFNEDRKFHEFVETNFELSVPAKKIDRKLFGLKWITPEYKANPEDEIDLILNVKSYLQNDKRKKMIMAHHAFFSVILDQKTFTPTRFFTKHGVSHPTKENKYFKNYRKFFIKKITENDIKVIYTIRPVDPYFPMELLSKECIKSSSLSSILDAHLILECDNLKSN